MIDRRTFFANPLLIPAISFMAGIVYGRTGKILIDLPLSPLPFIAILFTLFLFAIFKAKKIATSVSIILLFFMAGFIHLNKAGEPVSPSHIYNLISKPDEVTIAGTIRSVSSVSQFKGQILIKAEEILRKDGSSAGTNGLILINTDFSPSSETQPGSRVLARVELARVSKNGTPGSFDYRQYLADKNIYVTGRARSPAAVSLLLTAPVPDTLVNVTTGYFQKKRSSINTFISQSQLTVAGKGLYKAILIGDRGGIPLQVLENFQRSGSFHLLAISGMHMFLLFLLSTFILNLFLKRSTAIMLHFPVWKISAALSLLPLFYYTAISGGNPPSVRAFIMTTVLIIAIISDRQNSIFNTLCLAAFIILLLNPTALFSASFQLSFAAVCGIIIFNNHYSMLPRKDTIENNRFHPLIQWGKSSLLISLVALASTAPLTLYYFQQTSFLGPITTLLAAPAICFISLPLGLLSSLTHFLFPACAYFLLDLGSIALSFAEKVAAVGAAIPFSTIKHPPPDILQIIFYYLFLFSLIRFHRDLKSFIFPVIFLLAIFLVPYSGNFSQNRNDLLKVSFLDVGKGNATLLELPGGKNILIDGGTSASDDFNIGERIIAPFLWHKKIKTLDTIIITHAHSDHFNGLKHIVNYFNPKTIWVNGSKSDDRRYEWLLSDAERVGAKIITPEDGELLFESDETRVSCLKNLHLRQPERVSENSHSLVLKISSYGRTVILPGDIMKGDGKQFLAEETEGISVLLAPHHGSQSSASSELVESMKPEYLVVSAGAYKEGFFPDPGLEKSLQISTTELLNIRDRGTITCTIGPKDLDCAAVSDKGRDT